MKQQITKNTEQIEGQSSYSHEKHVDDILSKVNLSKITDEPILQSKNITNNNLNKKCWHLEGCNNLAVKRCFFGDENLKLGHYYASSHSNEYPGIMQICQDHINGGTYNFVIKTAAKIENII